MAEDFLSEENVCGKMMLDLVARGSAILAEMQRLHQHIPKIFQKPIKPYNQILYDFSYLNDPSEFQKRIQNSPELVQLNQTVKKTYMPLIQRFYKLFEAIYAYYEAITNLVREIQTGFFKHSSLETIFQYTKGKQLICEVIYLFGVMLLLLDDLMIGSVRERIVTCYSRNKGGESTSRINDIRKLTRNTGYLPKRARNQEYVRPDNYPQDYFARFKFDRQVIDLIIVAIKDDDIYKQMAAYPQAKLRSFALCNQASMLFVLLFLAPDILNNKKSFMREIVDKHFYNCWVTPYYLGYIVDLTEWWKPYNAAKLALGNVLDFDTIKEFASQFVTKQNECYHKCKDYLSEGTITQEFVTYNLTEMMTCIRESNVCLRWLILHRNTSMHKLKELIMGLSDATDILKLLLVCSDLESKFKEICLYLIANKENSWNRDREASAERLQEISDYFGKDQSLGKIESDQSLRQWFAELAQAIRSTSYSNSTYASRRIQSYIEALEDIQQYQQISSSIQLKQYLSDTRVDLEHMVKILSVKQSTITSIEIVCDITWSWIALKDYTKLMQKEIRRNPQIALLLKSTFMKLSSILNTPMVRLMEAESPDIESVSNFYSNELVKIVKQVLHIIPELVFQNLGNIIDLFTHRMITQPQKFDKMQLQRYAQPEERLQIGKYTNQISVFTESVFNIQNYLLGVVEVNPRQILQDGIRKELLNLLASILQTALCTQSKTPADFVRKISQLAARLQSFKLSLEYIQDFIHIYGLKIFHEQFQRLLATYVDMEKNLILTGQIGYEELNYQEDIPMPTISSSKCNTFIGFILNQVLSLTVSRKCMFLLPAYGFYDWETKKQVLTLKTLGLLNKCLGPGGLECLDYLLSFKIQEKLKKVVEKINRTCDDEASLKILNNCSSYLKHVGSFSNRYEQTVSTLKRTFKQISATLANEIIEIGQQLLLRDMICLELRMLSKTSSPRLFLVLESINNSGLNDLSQSQETDEFKIKKQNLLISLLSPYFGKIGLLEPLRKVYATFQMTQHFSIIVFAMIMGNIGLMDYDSRLKSLIRSKKQSGEPNYLVVGLVSLLNQFPESYKLQFLEYLASYIKSSINFILTSADGGKKQELMTDLFTYIRFIEEFVKYSKEPIEKYKDIIDISLLSSLDKNTLKNGYKSH